MTVVTWLALLVLDLIFYVHTGYFHSGVNFRFFPHLWDHMGKSFWCIRFYSPNFPFLAISLFPGVTAEFCLVESFNFFARCTYWSSSEYESTIDTLRGSALLNGFDWDVFFI